MGRKKKPLPLLEQVTISDAGAEGKAVARVDDLVVFVTGAVPGDVADVQVFRKRRRYLEGRPVKFHHYSDKRTEPVCTHFGTCGGCKWQHMGYDYQLHYKQQQVQDHLQRIGRLDLPAITPIMGAPATEYYRNKLEFSFSNQRWRTAAEMEEPLPADDQNALGFHVPGRFDKILDIQHCHLQAGISNDIRLAVKAYALEHSLSFF
ncbi:MAG: TRAM domain-containing protein, partial [Bacteroidota bacterium]